MLDWKLVFKSVWVVEDSVEFNYIGTLDFFFSSLTSYSIIFSEALHSCLRVNKRMVLWSVDLN